MVDPRLRRGVEAFNAGDYLTAHEIWEALWNDSVDAERSLLQGLVQIAAGYLKAESGISGGAKRLLARGVDRLGMFLPNALGLDLTAFVAAVTADVDRLERPAGTEGTIVRPPLLAWLADAPAEASKPPARA